jgi:hypothetical protein
VSKGRKDREGKAKEHTSNPHTPSRSPTAFTSTAHASRNAVCRNSCTGTSFPVRGSLRRSLGAKVEPAQKQVLWVVC